ncbi:UNVERIFIED_CONTAM: DUF21 domain-containing protein [Sesamum radiatum]|uniref:DUF21 domain-containing protein n=1 Tax=Sesamum radiatum TaxID=300843 RepID=A0AAW2TDZ7_SESRA
MRDNDTPCCEPQFWVNLAVSLALVSFAGLTSGLSIGLLSYSQVDLEVLSKAGLPQDKTNAEKILPIVKNECLLLCTLLIGKSLALEVIPQAICSRYGLSSGAKFVSFVRFLLFIFFPVAYPISKLLDWLLGKSRSALLRRTELKTLVDLHSIKAGRGGDLTDDETTIITGALGMREKTAKDAMTPIYKTFSLDLNSKLDMYTMGAIVSRGHSRVPIYAGSPTNIIGLVLVKNLIFRHPEDETPIKDLVMRGIPRVEEDWPLYDVLKLFQKGHSHMAVVVKSKRELTQTDIIGTNTAVNEKKFQNDPITYPRNDGFPSPSLDRSEKVHADIPRQDLESLKTKYLDKEAIGIITMEDVMEELLQEEILDETDHHVDIHRIRYNILTPRRLSSATDVASISSPSPSPYHHTPILRSPILPFVPSPFIKPVLYASPPARFPGTIRSSPSPYQIIKEKDRREICKYLFQEGVCYAKKDFNLAKHPEIDVPNLQVIKLMQSFKSKEYVRETFAWMHYYWYLTNDGIEFLRTYLNLPSEIVPATLKKSARPLGRPMGGPPGDRPRGPPRFEGDRPRFGDRDGYRGGPRAPPGEFGGEKGGAPADYQPAFRGGAGGRPGFGRGAGGFGGAPSS